MKGVILLRLEDLLRDSLGDLLPDLLKDLLKHLLEHLLSPNELPLIFLLCYKFPNNSGLQWVSDLE